MSGFTDVRRVMVLKLRHIGDVLLTVPVFRALKETFPGVVTTALVSRGTEAMLEGCPYVDDILVYDRTRRSGRGLRKAQSDITFYLDVRSRKFDMTVDLTSGDRPAIISAVSGARYRLGADPGRKGFLGKRFLYTHLAVPRGDLHTVLQNLAVVEPFGINTVDKSVAFAVSAAAQASADRLLAAGGISCGDRIVHIHPTSRWLFKCWHDASMAAVVERLIASGFKVVLTSSPEKHELDRAAAILAHLPEHPALIKLLGKTSLKELGAIAARAELFFGVDSAPMHIAAAVGTPVVALFGPSGAFHWGPWDNAAANSDAVPYPQRSGMQSFGSHTVLQRGWDCIPCGRDGCDGSKVSRCLMEITVDEVMAVIMKKLTGAGSSC